MAVRTVLHHCIVSHAGNVMVWYLRPVHYISSTIIRCTLNTRVRSVTRFLVDDPTLPNMFTRIILVCQFTRYSLPIFTHELKLVVAFSVPYIFVLPFLVLPFWYLLTRVVPDKFQKSSKTIVCVCVCVCVDNTIEILYYAKYQVSYQVKLNCITKIPDCYNHFTRYGVLN